MWPGCAKVRDRRQGGVARGAERGAALVLALCMLLALLLLGASAARMALQGEKAARADRDRRVAFHAAEEALMDAENDIEGSAAMPGRSAMFAPDSTLGFASGCGVGAASANPGLCLAAGEDETPVWQEVDIADTQPETMKSVSYGQFTGASMQTGQGLLPFQRPRYIIEVLPYTGAGADAGPAMSYFYRVTAIGFGARGTSEVVLQTYYRKPTVPMVAKFKMPARRMSWREIANWRELHAAAKK